MGLLEPQADNSQYLSVPIGVRTPHRFTVRIVKTLKYREHFSRRSYSFFLRALGSGGLLAN